MKKRVRIYKAGGQSNEPTQEQLIRNFIAEKMNVDNYDIDAIKEELIQAGIDETTADKYIEEADDLYGESDISKKQKIALAEAQVLEQQKILAEQNAAEEEARRQMYVTSNQDITNSVVDDGTAGAEEVARYGGSKLTKGNFIKQYTKFAKMAQGGDTPSPGSDDVLDGRKDLVNGFLNAVTRSANDAALRQEAEAQYHYAYGGIKMGEFEDGGIQQQQIDTESPLDHWSKQGATTRHIFSDNMYTQNDVAALEQYGGFTDSDSGLYKFIGGGDNELMDEQYQDSDLDYQRYAKRGGSLYKYQGTGNSIVDVNKNGISDFVERPEDQKVTDTEDYKKKYDELVTQNTTAAQKQQQMMQQYMMQQYMQQMGNQGMFRSPIISRGEQYNKAVGSPYYTQSGERYTGPDLAGRLPSSVNVDKYGIFGKPKKMTYNYGATPKIASFKVPTYNPGQGNVNNTSMGDPSDEQYRGKTFGERLGRGMVNTKIPGIQQLGAKLIPSGIGYEGPNKFNEPTNVNTSDAPLNNNTTAPIDYSQQINSLLNPKGRYAGKPIVSIPSLSGTANYADSNPRSSKPSAPAVLNTVPTANEPYYPPMSSRAQRRESRDDVKLNKFLTSNNNIDIPNDPKEIERMQKRDPGFQSFNPSETILPPTQYQVDQADENRKQYENFLLRNKEYGGPVDYTEYAYGGDISIPELYRAQTGFETGANDCPMGSTKDYKGDCVDFAGNVTKKRNTDFKMSEPEKLLENSFSQPKKNPLTGETPGIQVDSSGNYVNEGIKYGDQEGDQEGVSQKFRNKQAWNIDKAGVGDASLLIGNAFANTADEVRANRQENQMLENLTAATTLFGVNNAYTKGGHDPNSGLYNPDKMGFDGVISKYGGGVYAMGGNIADDDDEDAQWMTQEEIDDFRANGGELEFY